MKFKMLVVGLTCLLSSVHAMTTGSPQAQTASDEAAIKQMLEGVMARVGKTQQRADDEDAVKSMISDVMGRVRETAAMREKVQQERTEQLSELINALNQVDPDSYAARATANLPIQKVTDAVSNKVMGWLRREQVPIRRRLALMLASESIKELVDLLAGNIAKTENNPHYAKTRKETQIGFIKDNFEKQRKKITEDLTKLNQLLPDHGASLDIQKRLANLLTEENNKLSPESVDIARSILAHINKLSFARFGGDDEEGRAPTIEEIIKKIKSDLSNDQKYLKEQSNKVRLIRKNPVTTELQSLIEEMRNAINTSLVATLNIDSSLKAARAEVAEKQRMPKRKRRRADVEEEEDEE